MLKYEQVNWDLAECRGVYTDLFYKVEEERNIENYPFIDAVRSICARCPIWKDCLTYAIRNEDYGVWGGLTTAERRSVIDPRKYPAQFRRAMFSMEEFGISIQQIRECL